MLALATLLVLALAVALLPGAEAAVTTVQRVTDNERPDFMSDIAVDGNGFSHMVWRQEVTLNDDKIFYADNVAGPWAVAQISNGADDDMVPRIGVDGNGVSHVV